MRGGHLARLLGPLRRRVALMVGRAVLTLVDDARKMQSVQVRALESETLDGAERVQQYGMTSHPHPGAECVVLAVGGIRQHPLIIAVDDRRYRVIGLQKGEVCLYTDEDLLVSPHPRGALRPSGDEARIAAGTAGAHRVILKRGRVTEIRADHVHIVSQTLTHNGVDIGDTHTHGGVTAGPSSTAVPD